MSKSSKLPVFVGGTGRSGTTIVARVLGSHPEAHTIPIEVRFLVDPFGLCDLVLGETDFDNFKKRMLGPWWQRNRRDGTTRGLHLIMPKGRLLEALDELGESSDQGEAAARRFVGRILDPLAEAAGAVRWIEMTPPNVTRGNQLLGIFPDMKLIHSVRDGRDVACSVAARDWGPSDPFAALVWWEERMLEAHRACIGMGPRHYLAIRMENFVRDPNGSLSRLQAFLGAKVDPTSEAYMARHIRPKRSHIGRWKVDVDPSRIDEFEASYLRAVERLADHGVHVAVA
jgi:hypothetical protein